MWANSDDEGGRGDACRQGGAPLPRTPASSTGPGVGWGGAGGGGGRAPRAVWLRAHGGCQLITLDACQKKKKKNVLAPSIEGNSALIFRF